MAKSILHTIERNMPTFSKGQKRIADYILQNYDKAAFMTASKLGKLSGVSESTVVRFASELGYDGYPSMQRALQEMIRSRLTSTQRIQAADNLFGGQDVLSAVIQSDMDKLRMVAEEADRTEFNKVVDLILGAGHLYIPGGADLLLCGGVSELLPAPAVRERDAGAVQRRRGDLRAAAADRPRGCDDRHQLPSVLQGHYEHSEVCPGPGGYHRGYYRQ